MNSAEVDSKFYSTLDGIRGVAALIVVLWHAGAMFGLSQLHESYMAVDIFFVLSGAVICKTYENRLRSHLSVKSFSVIRLVRLYPLYILGSAISLVASLLSFRPDLSFTLTDYGALAAFAVLFVPNPFIGRPAQMYPFDFPAWSLFYELLTNIIYAFAIRFLKTRILLITLAVLGVGLAIFILTLKDHDANIGFTLKSFPAGICRAGFSFFMGVLLYRIFIQARLRLPISAKQKTILPWGILTILSVLLLYHPAQKFVPYYDLFSILIVFPALIYLGLHIEPDPITTKIFRFFGGISYALYAVHDSSFHDIEGFCTRFGISANEYRPLTGLVFLSVMIATCFLLDRYFDAPIRSSLTNRARRHGFL